MKTRIIFLCHLINIKVKVANKEIINKEDLNKKDLENKN